MQQATEHTKEALQGTFVSIDRKVFTKTKQERKEVKKRQNQFKGNGLFEWNERNRPGNNKKVA